MRQSNRVFLIIMNIIEIYIPSVMFLALFVAFILQIVSRYIFKNPLVWPYELAQISYLWVILLGTCYAARDDGNIVFSVAYEQSPPLLRKIFDLIRHALTVTILSVTIPATIDFYKFYFTRYSAVFRAPLGLVYFAFVPFLIITISRSAYQFVQCVKKPTQAYAHKRDEGSGTT